MWKILIFLIVGILIGSSLNMTERMKDINGKLQHFGVLLLLFVMGAAIGLDHDLLTQFQSLGFKAALFACFTTLFSVLVVYVISRLLLKGEKTS